MTSNVSSFCEWVFEQSRSGKVILTRSFLPGNGECFRVTYNQLYRPLSRCYCNGGSFELYTEGSPSDARSARCLDTESKEHPYVKYKAPGLAKARELREREVEEQREKVRKAQEANVKEASHVKVNLLSTFRPSQDAPVNVTLEGVAIGQLLGSMLLMKDLGYVMRIEVPGVKEGEFRHLAAPHSERLKQYEVIETKESVIVL